jgi:hypothetical protein
MPEAAVANGPAQGLRKSGKSGHELANPGLNVTITKSSITLKKNGVQT